MVYGDKEFKWMISEMGIGYIRIWCWVLVLIWKEVWKCRWVVKIGKRDIKYYDFRGIIRKIINKEY